MSQFDHGQRSGTSACRAEQMSVRPALTNQSADPPLSIERRAQAADFDRAMRESNTTNLAVAMSWGITESNVRRIRYALYPLTLAHLVLGDLDVFRRVLIRAVCRRLGKGAQQFLFECAAEAGKQ